MSDETDQAFEKWFQSHPWWKENSARENLKPVWDRMITASYSTQELPRLIDEIIQTMRNEYGE